MLIYTIPELQELRPKRRNRKKNTCRDCHFSAPWQQDSWFVQCTKPQPVQLEISEAHLEPANSRHKCFEQENALLRSFKLAKIEPNRLMQIVADEAGVKPMKIFFDRQKCPRELTMARNLFSFLLRSMGYSVGEISKRTGYTPKSVPLISVRTSHRISSDENMKELLRRVAERCNGEAA